MPRGGLKRQVPAGIPFGITDREIISRGIGQNHTADEFSVDQIQISPMTLSYHRLQIQVNYFFSLEHTNSIPYPLPIEAPFYFILNNKPVVQHQKS